MHSITDDDIEAAYHFNHRYIEPIRKAGKLNRAAENWYRKVDLMWGSTASGTQINPDTAQYEAPYTVAEVAAEMTVTQGYVRRLARRGEFDGAEKHGRDWIIPRRSVADYMEGRRTNGRARPSS